MIVFNDRYSRDIFASTYGSMLRIEAEKDGYKFEEMVKRELLDSSHELLLMTDSNETNEANISGYFAWTWYLLDDEGRRKNEGRPYMNGAWMNHGTIAKPDWSSHS